MSDELLRIAVDAARAAGALLLERRSAARTHIGTKSSATDMVSDADRAAEDLVLARLRDARPDDGVLGEETGEAAGTTGLRWVVDPLDGTTNYLYGIPHWAVSIACEDEDGPVVAVVLDPSRGELFAASRDGGATCNGEALRVGDGTDAARALIGTGFGYVPEDRGAAAVMLATILPRVRDVRRGGAAALDLAWVARGWLDGYYEVPISHWDVAAGRLLVTEAGGRVADLPAFPGSSSGPGLLCAGPGIFDALRGLVEAAHPA